MVVGLRVVRGPDWPYDDQDGGRNHAGTVVAVNSDTNVTVHWDMGSMTKCRVGENGKHDILALDSRPVGVFHPGVECVRCEDGNIVGALWKCTACKSANLCTPCYYSDGHLPTHPFSRIDYPGAKPVVLTKRSISQRARALGIYIHAEVTRGPSWAYGNQDGGAGRRGVVEESVVSGRGGAWRITVRVKWEGGAIGAYRLGLDGKVDVICVEEAAGPDFYTDHLAKIDVAGFQKALQQQQQQQQEQKQKQSVAAKFAVGDKVCVAVSTSELKQLQKGRGFTRQLTGEVGVVKRLTSTGDVDVDFKGDTLTITPAALKKLTELQTGDFVKVVNSTEKVQLLQTTRGGWTESMSQAVGKVGKVTMVDEDGDVVVNFGGKKHVFHPACLEPSTQDGKPAPATSAESFPRKIVKPAVPPKPTEPKGAEGGTTGQSAYECGSDELQADDNYYKDNNKTTETKPDFSSSFDGLAMLKALVQGTQNQKEIFLKAVIDGKEGTVKQLLAIDKNLAKLDVKNIPCLSLASHFGHTNVVIALVDAGADMNRKDDSGNTALVIALSEQKGDPARILIEKGANVSLTGSNKLSPLHLAVHKNMIGHLKLLLNKGANPNTQDTSGDTPLHDAIVTKHDTAAEILIDNPRLNVWMTNDKNFTTLGLACLKAHTRIVEKLLDKEPGLSNGRMDGEGYYPLHICAVNDHVTEAKLLFAKGQCKVDCRNVNKLTPLHMATLRAHVDMVQLLLSHNADVSAKDSDGDTPLHLVVRGRRNANDALRLLLGLQDDEDTAVKLQMARLLVEKGADVDTPNNDGLTPVTSCTNIRLREAIRQLANERAATAATGQVRPSTASVGTATNVNPSQKCHGCGSKIADTCFLPCRHQYACADCVTNYRRCPACHRDVDQIIDLRSKRVRDNVDCKVQ